MKKIIDGALYNTETAKKLGTWDNGIYGNDFRTVSEELYQTKSGKYFKHGEGGPMTVYAEHHGNSTSGGEQILPLTPEEAREWAEEKLTAEEYSAIFGEPEEASDLRKPVNITLPEDVIRLLTREKEQTGISISQLIERAVTQIYQK